MSSDMFGDLNPPYATIVADPPWPYEGKINPPNPGTHYRPAVKYDGGSLAYSSMNLDAIRGLPVATIAALDCRLFLWVTNRYLRQSWEVVEAWGFVPLGRSFVWCKQPMGTANVTTEFFLVGRRGNPPPLPWCGTTWFDWKRQHHAHSRKPAPFYDLVEQWCPGPYVELFARAPRLGWDSWGWGYETAGETRPA